MTAVDAVGAAVATVTTIAVTIAVATAAAVVSTVSTVVVAVAVADAAVASAVTSRAVDGGTVTVPVIGSLPGASTVVADVVAASFGLRFSLDKSVPTVESVPAFASETAESFALTFQVVRSSST